MEDIIVCVIDPYDFDSDDIRALNNKDFHEEAIRQDKVYSLKAFEDVFNNEDISDLWFIRFINKYSITQ